jgi:CBS domain-containing protein
MRRLFFTMPVGLHQSATHMGKEVKMRTVRDIMTTTVQTIHHHTFVCEVEGIFLTHKISGAPLVDDLGNLVAFVSMTDITHFDSTGGDPNYARVYEIANPKVITIESGASIEDAAQKMLHEHVHHLVVMEEAAMVGVLSAFDFVRLVAQNAGED